MPAARAPHCPQRSCHPPVTGTLRHGAAYTLPAGAASAAVSPPLGLALRRWTAWRCWGAMDRPQGATGRAPRRGRQARGPKIDRARQEVPFAMKMLFVGTHGSESPTHAVLPLLQAQGAIDEGHEAELLLVGDAVVLMRDAVAKATIG